MGTNYYQIKQILKEYSINDIIYAFMEYFKDKDIFSSTEEVEDFVRDKHDFEIVGFLIEECERRGDDVLDILEQNRCPY